MHCKNKFIIGQLQALGSDAFNCKTCHNFHKVHKSQGPQAYKVCGRNSLEDLALLPRVSSSEHTLDYTFESSKVQNKEGQRACAYCALGLIEKFNMNYMTRLWYTLI